MSRMAVILLFWAITLFFQGCDFTSDPHTDGGSGSDVEATVVAGQVVDSNGNPVSGVAVRLREATYLAKNSGYETEMISVKLDTHTLEGGYFFFNNLNPGNYTIEAYLDDSLASFSILTVNEGDELIQHPADTLFPFAILTGNVQVEDNIDALPTVQVFGLDRFVLSDTGGQFEIKVPHGNHTLRIADDISTFDDIDTLVHVKHGRRHPLGRFKLGNRCQEYHCDSTVVRELLYQLGLDSISVEDVTRRDSTRIVEVYLRERELHKMPRRLIKLKRLEVLDLGRNNLTKVMLKPLRNLKTLILDGNQLTEIREDIGHLERLQQLDFSDNELVVLPETITRLKLDYLDLSNNQLCDVNDNVAVWADTLDVGWRERQRCPAK